MIQEIKNTADLALIMALNDSGGGGSVEVDDTLTVEGMAADAKATGDEIRLLDARMDTFASLDDGSTTGDAELADIRVKEDGTVSSTAGNAVREQIGNLKTILNSILVEETSESELGQVTVTNAESISAFYDGVGGSLSGAGFTSRSLSNGVATYTGGNGSQISPYLNHVNSSGEKKWIVGFKYKVSKLDSNLGNPESVRIHLGSTQYYDANISYGEWVDFAQTATVNLTRIRFALWNFASAPASDSFTVEIKNIYLYDASDINDNMCAYIMQQQSFNYQDGTVTYGSSGEQTTYVPDTTLTESGKVADAKAVGDAIAAIADDVQDLTDDFVSIDDGVDLLLTEKTAVLTNQRALSDVVGRYGLTRDSISGGVSTFTPSSSPDVNPAANDVCSLGINKWLVGFKYKITKLDQTLGDPDDVTVILGQNNKYTAPITWGTWVQFMKIDTVDLTRVYFQIRNFATAPSSGQLKLEIKDYFIYNVSSVDSDLLDYITTQQADAYTDGTVSYSKRFIGDSIALSLDQINVLNYGVKGDGVTDDTAAIQLLFSKKKGNFYFPGGIYKISGMITLPENSTMYGDGDDTVIEMYNCDNLTAMTFRGTDKIYPYILAGGSNTKFHDFKLIGNNSLKQQTHGGICALDTSKCLISDVTIYNINFDANQDNDATVSGYGIYITRSTDSTVQRCNVQRCGYECIGIVDDCDRCTVRDCYTKNGWRTCIQVHRGSCNTLIDNCTMIQDHPKYNACFTVHGLPGQIVDNLTVNNCVAKCLQDGAQPYDYCAPYQIMSDTNRLCFTQNKAIGGRRAFYITSSHTNAKIIGNDFRCNDNSDYGVTIKSLNTIVIGNYLENEAETQNVISNNPILIGNIGIGS